MFSHSEMRLLINQLAMLIKQMQKQVNETDLHDPAHVRLENKLITLVGIKRKVMAKLENSEPPEITCAKNRKVLIVDDSETVREVVRCYFNELGFKHVDCAIDGLQAWRKLQMSVEKCQPYGLLVSDWNMPNMTGLQLLQAVREDTSLCSLPTYLITGIRDKDRILTAIRHGINGYLIKPVNFNHIKKHFAKYLGE
ncbi:MAG: two-component system chemotaxis response regulator CheY [Phenylobacterium sp.]|jgi:two-component system chemotaxis response regulator CheY